MREPLPMPVKTTLAYAEASRRVRGGSDGDPDVKGRAEWETDRASTTSASRARTPTPAHVRVFGERAARRLLAAPARAGEAEPHRLGHCAWRLWSRCSTAAHEQIRGLTVTTGARLLMDAFDIRDPLPTGTTLLEASAGTGKTWTIGALVTRYVAEGEAALDQMLVVTFGRAASQELRERVRAPARRGRAGARRPARSRDAAPDRLLDCCSTPTRAELDARRPRLRDALGAFDAATIATTHQFCQLVLRSLGVAGDTDANATLVEDLERPARRGRSTTSTSRRFAADEDDAAVHPRRGAGARPRRRSATRRPGSSPPPS